MEWVNFVLLLMILVRVEWSQRRRGERLRRHLALLIALAGAGSARSQPNPAGATPTMLQVERESGAREAQAQSLVDLKAAVGNPLYLRWLWIPGGDHVPQAIKAVSFACNWLSNTGLIKRPVIIGGGKVGDTYSPALLRIDLTHYAARPEDLERWVRTWEKLANDPNFSRLITADTIKLLSLDTKPLPAGVKEIHPQKGWLLIPTKPYKQDGYDYDVRWVNVLREPAPFLDPQILRELEGFTHSQAPVVHWQYFLMRALASIQDEGLYRDVFGGLYYEFAGVRTAKEAGKKKATDLDVLFEDLGIIDDADGGLKAQAKLDRLGSDQRLAMLRSQVTGKVRACFILPTLKSVRKRGVVFLTVDIKDGSIDLNKNVFANLLDIKADAQEVIWNNPNGSQGYALYNAAGALQQEVPPDVAMDHTIPTPYTKRLQTTGCIICHAGTHDGWQPLPNEVILSRRGPEVLTDLSDKKRHSSEVLDLLAAKYGGNADETLSDLRRGLIGSVLAMTGPYAEDRDQTGAYRLTAAIVEKVRSDYWYTPVSAPIALAEMRIRVPRIPQAQAQDVLGVFRELLRPDPLSKIEGAGIILEDYRIGQLLAGRTISRTDWELVKSFATNRAYQTLTARGAK